MDRVCNHAAVVTVHIKNTLGWFLAFYSAFTSKDIVTVTHFRQFRSSFEFTFVDDVSTRDDRYLNALEPKVHLASLIQTAVSIY